MEDREVCIGETELIIKLRPRLPCCQFLCLSIRIPTVREKSVKNEKNSRSGKSQGILNLVREI